MPVVSIRIQRFDIILEASNETGIIGGRHSKTFKIKCETVNIKPYYLNATVNGNIGGQSNPSVVAMATTPTPTPVTSLLMVIKDTSNTNVTRAEIGQKLTIAIKIPDKTTIKPTECKASGNGKEVTLWTESGCTYNEDLFGTNWLKRNETSEISNTMYGFRFVGSESVTILCRVRVCPDGYKGDKCDLNCHTKRKRTNRLSDDVTMEQASASLAITDSPIIVLVVLSV
ncbi:uncharacterized protein [Argopecten irradians]|uniref:uncharacterized protein n=1 Tax=Argopecten irradians TaxID=31199 RepID=UPI00371384E2